MRESLLIFLLAASAYVLASVVAPPPERMQVGTLYANQVLVTTNQMLNPMNSVPGAAPEEDLNRILWHVARGWRTPYPRVPHRSDCPPGKG